MNLAANESRTAVELSALSEPELAGLIDFLRTTGRPPFEFVSLHAPSKDRAMPERDLVALLVEVAPLLDAIVFHPDKIDDIEAYRPLGKKMVIENMDRRKEVGQTEEQLRGFLEALPEAGLCLDLAHARHVDESMEEGNAILSRYWSRLRHLHVSSVDDHGHHIWLTPDDEQRFAPILDRCRDVPWILEAHPTGR